MSWDSVSIPGRLATIATEEYSTFHLRRSLALGAIRCLPPLTGNRLRRSLLRAGGVRAGRGTTFGGPLTIAGGADVTFGSDCWVNGGCHFDVSAPITIGDGVALAQEVMILTNTHEIGDPTRRAGDLRTLPVSIGDGAWLGARAVVLPGVSVGAGAIVGAGAVVTRDVEADTVVVGVPARSVRRLEAD